VGRAIASVPEVFAVEVDPERYDPIIQSMGIVAATRRPDDAGRFGSFVLSAEGQGILKDYGFAPPPPVHAASMAMGSVLVSCFAECLGSAVRHE
jgi:hypothetical protein